MPSIPPLLAEVETSNDRESTQIAAMVLDSVLGRGLGVDYVKDQSTQDPKKNARLAEVANALSEYH